MYLRDAHFEVLTVDIHCGMRNLIFAWLHMSVPYSNSIKDNIRVLHRVHVIDQFINIIFSGTIVYYSSLFIGSVRFTTTEYARNKVSDDSSVIFKIGSKENFSRIRRIFTVNSGEPIICMDVISQTVSFECTTATDVFSYPYIETVILIMEDNRIFISADNIVEKCVFYERTNNCCTFYRLPNLKHSS